MRTRAQPSAHLTLKVRERQPSADFGRDALNYGRALQIETSIDYYSLTPKTNTVLE
jgi:hypothetical protein